MTLSTVEDDDGVFPESFEADEIRGTHQLKSGVQMIIKTHRYSQLRKYPML